MRVARVASSIVFVLLMVFLSCGYAGADTMYDLTTPGSSVTINGAIFTQGSVGSGTGIFNSFLRVHANGTEYGYNTDQFPHPPLDIQPGPTWTHSVLVSALPVVTFNGVAYYQFLLDINQAQGEGDKKLLSLDVLQFYTGTTTSPKCCPPGGDFGAARYNLDAGTNNYILLDSSLSHGSGTSDMAAYIPVSDFAGNTNPYLYLYSGFGENNASNGGFEEWGLQSSESSTPGPTVPEPSSVMLLGSGLLTGLAGLKRGANRIA